MNRDEIAKQIKKLNKDSEKQNKVKEFIKDKKLQKKEEEAILADLESYEQWR